MAYKKEELEKKALENIKKYKLYFIHDVIYYLPCSCATFYNHKLEKLESIKEALEKNKIKTKVGLRKKWYDSDNATAQIALYKLIGTDEESDRINSQKNKVEHSGKINIEPKQWIE